MANIYSKLRPMTSANVGDEVVELHQRLTDDLASLMEDFALQSRETGKEQKRNSRRATKVGLLLAQLIENGPSSSTVSRTAQYTGVSVVDYLHMTADNHWERVNLSPTHAAPESPLAAPHIFDEAAIQQMSDIGDIEQMLQKLQLATPLVTEASVEEPSAERKTALFSIMQWAKIARIVDINGMRRVEAARLALNNADWDSDRPPNFKRHLASAEAIATVLRYADDNVPARIVTSTQLIARYTRIGLKPTSIWGMFSDAIAEGRLSTSMAAELRELRQKHDTTFQPKTSSWPQKPPPMLMAPKVGQDQSPS